MSRTRPPGEALELLRHRAGLHPDGLVRGPGESTDFHPECDQQPLAQQLLQGDCKERFRLP